FTPAAGYRGAASVTVTADDQGNTGAGGPLSDSDTVAITLSSNSPPTATDNTASVREDVTLSASGNVISDDSGSGVDSDPDNDPLSVSAVNGAAGNVGASVAGTYGSVTIAASGSYTYTLNNASAAVQSLKAGQTVTDVFSYTASDGNGGASTA